MVHNLNILHLVVVGRDSGAKKVERASIHDYVFVSARCLRSPSRLSRGTWNLREASIEQEYSTRYSPSSRGIIETRDNCEVWPVWALNAYLRSTISASARYLEPP